ncbi:hypothetical protein SK128_003484 [Halocaridina rubra]|uniref:Uncharacterized protein n=1 Tax=Halocaridina rubra TaxID=373956 RepID=A0AAN9FX85_HALRR
MLTHSNSGDERDIPIPGSVDAHLAGKELNMSPRALSASSSTLFYPASVPVSSSLLPVEGLANTHSTPVSQLGHTPVSFRSTPTICSPPPSISSFLDLSISSAISCQTGDSLSAKRPRLEPSLGSEINVAIFSPDSSLSSESDNLVSSFGSRHNTPVSARTLNGKSPTHFTSAFIPFTGNLVIFSKQKSLDLPSMTKDSLLGDRTFPSGSDFAVVERPKTSAPFITLPGSALQRPESGWLDKDCSAVSMTQLEGPSVIRYPLRNGVIQHSRHRVAILHHLRSNTVAPFGMPSVDTRSVNGFFRPAFQSSTVSDPDAIGMGVVSAATSGIDLVGGEDEEEASGECGWLCLKPRALQKTRTAKWILFWLCWVAAAQATVVYWTKLCCSKLEFAVSIPDKEGKLFD